eukprot:Skav206200  [mRNA]  locus=scaffold1844:356360:357364:- [translate_table: standard]
MWTACWRKAQILRFSDEYRGKREQTALHEAAWYGRRGRAYCIKELLRVMPEVTNEKDRAGQTAIHCAAAEGVCSQYAR